MDHYLDIRLRPEPELPATHLMDVLVGRLHLALAARAEGDIGISFPEHGSASSRSLGEVLRLHGRAAALDALMAGHALAGGVADHVDIGPVTAVPPGAAHRVVRRVQAKSSAARMRRRQMRRHGYDEQQAREQVPDTIERTLALPCLHLRSASTGQFFPLFIEHGPLLPTPRPGNHGAYGLSASATLPWF